MANAGSVVTCPISRLVTTQSCKVLEEAPEVQLFFLVATFPLPIPHPVVPFRSRSTACGIELLGDLGKAIVASVQQIASHDSEPSR